MFDSGTIWVLLALVAIIVVAVKTLVLVPQGFEYTRERLGKFSETMPPGPHWLIFGSGYGVPPRILG